MERQLSTESEGHDSAGHRWLSIRTIAGQTKASLIADYLRTEGIQAWVRQEAFGRAIGLSTGPSGCSYLMVREKDVNLVEPILHRLLDYLAGCPSCGTELELSIAEMEQGWFTCPECTERVELKSMVTCPNCGSRLQLDEGELEAGNYVCPDCEETVFLAE
jgi:uncharacterized protein YbaR (Trm112 family)